MGQPLQMPRSPASGIGTLSDGEFRFDTTNGWIIMGSTALGNQTFKPGGSGSITIGNPVGGSTAEGILYVDSSNNLANTAAMTNGQVLVGQTGAAPLPKTISGSGATITLSAAGVLTISAIANTTLSNSSVTVSAGTGLSGGGTVSLGSSVTLSLSTPVSATNGGTAQSTWTLGDTLYASATNTLSKLAGNTTSTKNYLTQTGTGSVSAAPSWSTIAAADVPVFIAAGASHAVGVVPDPGSTTHANPYLLGDNASWIQITGTAVSYSGGVYTINSGAVSGANPTATVGTTAVNGTATTFMRSDGAPAINQAMAPTWTGNHTFNTGTITFNAGMTINAASGFVISGVGSSSYSPSVSVTWVMSNSTAATSIQDQYSPYLEFLGHGWNTNSSASQAVSMALCCTATRGNPPVPAMTVSMSDGAGTVTTPMTLAANGGLTVGGTGTTAQTTINGKVAMPGLRGQISGFQMSAPGSGTTLTLTAGECRDSTNVVSFASAITSKVLGATWASGSGSNGLDTGTPTASALYYVYAICKNSDQSGDIRFSLSATSPTMPTGYTYFRRIGAFYTDSSKNILKITQNG
ncbi:MAG: hypothetical protein KGL39_40645, partial [Patescibacteria group bacterium]|nr:hypothetical protein [Patescibacteria group bacterium]